MKSPRRSLWCAVLLSLVLVCPVAAQDDGWRTIEFETTEVTDAGVALSPDGEWLIFTLLGHLFRLPVEGGEAEQLTFGPYYDTDPVFSPDGSRVAFVSDRDGSEGNVFVLELATGEIAQVTHEAWAGRPAWSPDGEEIVYLRFVREAFKAETWYSMPALVRRVRLATGEPEALSSAPRLFRSVFYLPDGRLAWTVLDFDAGSMGLSTRIEVLGAEGTLSNLRTLEGIADRIVPSPTTDALYARRPFRVLSPRPTEQVDLLLLPLPEGPERLIAPLSPSGSFWPFTPQFAVGGDKESLYVSDLGRLWKIGLPNGVREPIAFRARVRLGTHEPTPVPKAVLQAPGSVALRSVLSPRLSPDGRVLVFGAAGFLWEQRLDGGQAQRLFEGSAFESWPAFSPDGKELAFVHSEYGANEVRVFDFETGRTRTVAPGPSGKWQPSWSADAQRLVFGEYEGGLGEGNLRCVAVNLGDGGQETLAETGLWSPRPHFSADGRSLYFSANTTGTGTLYRLPLSEEANPEPITELARHLSEGLVSPDGRWLAFRRGTEIWVSPLGNESVKEEQARRLSAEGGDTFTFTPDSSALIYSVGSRVWRHPLTGGEREEIPVRLELRRPTPPPVLIRRVRVLDFETVGFGQEAALFIEHGRIRWIGSEAGRRIPPETVTLDAGGRFAIPGLFDLHVHGDRFHGVSTAQEAFLAYGITSVREPGGWLTWLNALADRGETTSDPLPRYFFSGEIFEGSEPASGDVLMSLLIHNEEDARTYVRRWKERGAHFIKVYPTLPWPLQRAVAEEARRQGLPVVGHGMSAEEVTRSVILGYWSLEHGGFFYDDVLGMLAAVGTRWDPTVGIAGGNHVLLRDEPERWTETKFRAFIREQNILLGPPGSDVSSIVLRGYWAERLASIRTAHRRGVQLQAGTDAAHQGVFYGSSLHWELEHFVQAGLTPLEVLRIATQEGAAAVGADDDLGTLEVGKLADIVLLDADPLEDIKNTQTIWRVLKGGWVFDPEELRPPSGN